MVKQLIVFDISEETGQKILQYQLVKGVKQGYYNEWYPDGTYKIKGYYNRGMSGTWTYYYENGQIQATGEYERDSERDVRRL